MCHWQLDCQCERAANTGFQFEFIDLEMGTSSCTGGQAASGTLVKVGCRETYSSSSSTLNPHVKWHWRASRQWHTG
jgi:hypothetical protein